MDSPRDHLDREIASLRGEIGRIAQRLNELERAARDPAPEAAPKKVEQPSVAQVAQPSAPTAPDWLDRVPTPSPPKAKPVERAIAPKPKREDSSWSLERLVGAKAFAAAGALIVVLGVAFFLKLAIDEGWIQRISPMWRCIGVAGFGGVLIALGEIARKRINVLASSGLSAAGIATVYASVYGAREVFGLISPPSAMVLLVLVTAGGVALGVIGRRVFLSGISLIGAYLAPLLLNEGEPSPVFFPAYLIALMALGLTLGGWMGGRFHVLRSIAWWGTLLMGTIWIVGWAMERGPINGLVFVGIVWVVTHAELIASARFYKRGASALESPPPASLALHGAWEHIRWSHARWIVSSFGVTTWALGLSVWLFREIDASADYLAPVILGVALGAVSIVAMPRIMAILTDRRTPRAQLATATVIQVGAMVIAAVALGLTQWSQVIAWVALGVAAVVTGERINVRALRVYGSVLLVIGTARVVALDWAPALAEIGSTPDLWIERWGLALGPIGAQLAGAGLGWLLGAVAVRRREAESSVMGALGIVCVMAAMITPGVEAGSLAVAWAALGACAALVSRTGIIAKLGVIAVAPIVAAWVPWLFAYADPAIWVADGSPVGLSIGMRHGAALVAAGIGAVVVQRTSTRKREVMVFLLACTAFMTVVATSLEVHRVAGLVWTGDESTARRGAVSIWWAVVGLASLGAGWARRMAVVRWVGLGLLGAAAAKLVVFDLIEISMAWRVATSMVIGLILLGVAVGYARAMRGKKDAAVGEMAE